MHFCNFSFRKFRDRSYINGVYEKLSLFMKLLHRLGLLYIPENWTSFMNDILIIYWIFFGHKKWFKSVKNLNNTMLKFLTKSQLKQLSSNSSKPTLQTLSAKFFSKTFLLHKNCLKSLTLFPLIFIFMKPVNVKKFNFHFHCNIKTVKKTF